MNKRKIIFNIIFIGLTVFAESKEINYYTQDTSNIIYYELDKKINISYFFSEPKPNDSLEKKKEDVEDVIVNKIVQKNTPEFSKTKNITLKKGTNNLKSSDKLTSEKKENVISKEKVGAKAIEKPNRETSNTLKTSSKEKSEIKKKDKVVFENGNGTKIIEKSKKETIDTLKIPNKDKKNQISLDEKENKGELVNESKKSNSFKWNGLFNKILVIFLSIIIYIKKFKKK